MKPHLLLIGGEDHALRIPFMLAMRDHGFRVSAAATGDPGPFVRAGIDYHHFRFERFVNPLADWSAFKTISRLLATSGLSLFRASIQSRTCWFLWRRNVPAT